MPGRWKPWNTVWNTNHSLTNPACGGIAARLMAANNAPAPNPKAVRLVSSAWRIS